METQRDGMTPERGRLAAFDPSGDAAWTNRVGERVDRKSA